MVHSAKSASQTLLKEACADAAGARTNATPDTQQTRYRIVHLSDLHFGGTFDCALWDSIVEQLTIHIKPDLILVTGDVVNSPSLFGLALARNQLLKLGAAANCPVYAIAGNHDVGILGNLRMWPFKACFDIVFSGTYDKRIIDAGTFTEHQKLRLWRRAALRAGWTVRLGALRMLRSLKPHPRASIGLIDDRQVDRALIARFDSNDQMLLATGKIREEEILALEGAVSQLRGKDDRRWLCPRIALVHHHVLPIPHSTTTESMTSFEPFMVLRNAGTLAFELSKLHFDLVLHGHKHYWNAARLTLDSPGQEGSELAVVSAGSATVRYGDAGRNSFNVIDVNPNGSIVHRPIFYGAGGTFAGMQAMRPTQPRLMFSLDTLKRRARLKAMERAECMADVIERNIVIDEDGGGDYHLAVRGFHVFGARRTRQQQLIIALESGAISPASVHLGPVSSRQGHQLKLDKSGVPNKLLVIPIDLGRELFGEHDGLSFDATARAVNTFSITEWEAAQLDALGPDDTAGIVVRQPAMRMQLSVTFPEILINLEPHLVVQRPASYPLLGFDDMGEICVSMDDVGWVVDQDMTTYEQPQLRQTGERTWQLNIDEPMVGFRYQLCWKVKTQQPDVSRAVRGRAQQMRRELLRLCEPKLPAALPPPLQSLRDLGQEALEDAFLAYIEPEFHSSLMASERLGAALYVYDESVRALRMVFEHGTGDFVRGLRPVIPLNEGVDGTAFKKRAPAMYLLSAVLGEEQGYVYYPATPPTDEAAYAVVVAMPVYLGKPAADGISPEQIIGVFTVVSNARDSGLIKLLTGVYRDGVGTPVDEANEAGSGLWAFALRYLAGLASELEREARTPLPPPETSAKPTPRQAQGPDLK